MKKNYQEMYKSKLTTPQEAVKLIEDGNDVITPLANGIPLALANALGDRILQRDLRNISICTNLELFPSSLFNPKVAKFGTNYESGFVGPAVRQQVASGIFGTINNNFSESTYNTMNYREIDAVLYAVAPMDEHGYFSTSLHADWAFEMAKKDPHVKHVLVEVNENLPRTFGNNALHISEVSAVVENNAPLVTLPEDPISEKDKTIASYIAELIPDEACVQLGIGSVPNAVATFLENKKDLGIHTEMVTDSMVDLYEKGVITCRKKNFMPDKMLCSFVLGSQKLYDFVHENPIVEVRGTSFANNPFVISQNDNMISINATLQVDLLGQCCSESIGFRQFSGPGGQLDFVRGTYRSKGGKSFLTTYSTYTDKEGNLHSSITPILSPGAVVTVPRVDVQYIVTEYGIAFLKGQGTRTRIESLIKIAHPDFRDQLRFEAKKVGWLM